MLTESFITEYIKLDKEHETGDGIWRLCEMSAMVVVPRGEHHIDAKYKRKQETGDTLNLSRKARKNEDTIGRRAFAWRQWERFLEFPLFDTNGNELDMTHRQVRDRLFHGHFAELGQKVEDGTILPEDATTMLVLAVENNSSINQMMAQYRELVEEETYFNEYAWPAFAKKAASLLKYPQLTGRRKKLVRELAGTDWNAKDAADRE